jgi:hypothetical protein
MLRFLSALGVLAGVTIAATLLIYVVAFAFWAAFPSNLSGVTAAIFFLMVAPGLGLLAGLIAAGRMWAATDPLFPEPFLPQRAGRATPPLFPRHPRLTPSSVEQEVGVLHIALGGACLLGGFLAFGPFASITDEFWPGQRGPALAVFLLLGTAFFLPILIGGVGLVRGWIGGRPIASVMSILMLALFPIGTILGVISLRRFNAAPRPKPRQLTPAEQILEAQREAYAQDKQAVCTCPHVAPAERAARNAGLVVLPMGWKQAQLQSPVGGFSLTEALPRDTPVRLITVTAPDHAENSAPQTMLHCSLCQSSLILADVSSSD